MSAKHFEKRSGFLTDAERERDRIIKEKGGEPISMYFSPQWSKKPVLRHELASILSQYHRVQRDSVWYNRLWRFLKAPLGSGPVRAVEPQKTDEVANDHS